MNETHEEFAARMDRARAASAAETNRATIIAILVYAVIGASYYWFDSTKVNGLYVLFFVLDSLLILVSVRLLVGLARSKRT